MALSDEMFDEIRGAHGYVSDIPLPVCENCYFFNSEVEKVMELTGRFFIAEERDLQCGKGGFPVQRKATCMLHEYNRRCMLYKREEGKE